MTAFWKLAAVALFIVALLLPRGLTEPAQEINQAQRGEGIASKPLRSQKVGAIWDKARKRISSQDKLSQLSSELQALDDEYMALKKVLSEDGDPMGELEASLGAKTEEILRNYDLWDHFKDTHGSGRPGGKEGGRDAALRKLDLLVEKAQLAGFTAEELDDLRTEIQHHKKKMDEYEQLQEQFEQLVHKSNLIVNPGELDGEDGRSMHDGHDRMRTLLKEKHKDIRNGYEKLKLLSDNPIPLKNVDFSDPKLISLWAEALKANFTKTELQSLKAELSHLQQKMAKHDALKEEASLVKKRLKKQERANELSEDMLQAAAARHEEISNQADEYGHMVKKYIREIKNRIKDARQRTEL